MEPWTQEIVAAVTRHMNDDHAEDNLRIVRALGGVPDAVAVRMLGCDATGLAFETSDGREALVAWDLVGAVPQTRGDIRHAVVRLHDAAVQRLAPQES